MTDAATIAELHRHLVVGFDELEYWSKRSVLAISHQLIFAESVDVFQFALQTPRSNEYGLRVQLQGAGAAQPWVVPSDWMPEIDARFDALFSADEFALVESLRESYASPLVRQWIESDKRIGAISTHARAHHGLFNPGHRSYLARILNTTENYIDFVADQASDWNRVRSICEERTGATESRELEEAMTATYTISAMLRGFVHADVAMLGDNDAAHHPIREEALRTALPTPDRLAGSTKGEQIIAAIPLAYSLIGRKSDEREQRFADCVKVLRESMDDLSEIVDCDDVDLSLRRAMDWSSTHPFFSGDREEIAKNAEAITDWAVTLAYLVVRLCGQSATPYDPAIAKALGSGAKAVVRKTPIRDFAKPLFDPEKQLRVRVAAIQREATR